MRSHDISANLFQLWLTQFDRGEQTNEEAEASFLAEYEARMAALERKVGRLTMELDLAKKTPRMPTMNGSETSSVISGPAAAGSGGGARPGNRRTHGHRAAATPEGLTSISEDNRVEWPCYGYRRATHELRRHGFLINHKRVARVMPLAGLGMKPRRRFVRTTGSQHDCPRFPYLYRNPIPDQPDRAWVADVTFIRVSTGFCFLAAILDACSRKGVG